MMTWSYCFFFLGRGLCMSRIKIAKNVKAKQHSTAHSLISLFPQTVWYNGGSTDKLDYTTNARGNKILHFTTHSISHGKGACCFISVAVTSRANPLPCSRQ
jgi:hypothetical protein